MKIHGFSSIFTLDEKPWIFITEYLTTFWGKSGKLSEPPPRSAQVLRDLGCGRAEPVAEARVLQEAREARELRALVREQEPRKARRACARRYMGCKSHFLTL